MGEGYSNGFDPQREADEEEAENYRHYQETHPGQQSPQPQVPVQTNPENK